MSLCWKRISLSAVEWAFARVEDLWSWKTNLGKPQWLFCFIWSRKMKRSAPLFLPITPSLESLKFKWCIYTWRCQKRRRVCISKFLDTHQEKKKVDNCSFLMRRAVSYLLKYGAVYFEVRLDLHTEQRFSDAWLFSFAAGGWLMLLSKHQDIQLRAMSRNTSNGKVRQTFSSRAPPPLKDTQMRSAFKIFTERFIKD